MAEKTHKFNAIIDIIGINPFVFVPDEILIEIFKQFGKNNGHIPIKGEVNGKVFKQTLVKYKGSWNLNPRAKTVFNNLSKSGKNEIVRYISHLKTEESIDRNINKAIDFLHGKGRFVGRDKH